MAWTVLALVCAVLADALAVMARHLVLLADRLLAFAMHAQRRSQQPMTVEPC